MSKLRQTDLNLILKMIDRERDKKEVARSQEPFSFGPTIVFPFVDNKTEPNGVAQLAERLGGASYILFEDLLNQAIHLLSRAKSDISPFESGLSALDLADLTPVLLLNPDFRYEVIVMTHTEYSESENKMKPAVTAVLLARYEGFTAMIEGVVVDEKYRHQGLSLQLLVKITEIAQKMENDLYSFVWRIQAVFGEQDGFETATAISQERRDFFTSLRQKIVRIIDQQIIELTEPEIEVMKQVCVAHYCRAKLGYQLVKADGIPPWFSEKACNYAYFASQTQVFNQGEVIDDALKQKIETVALFLMANYNFDAQKTATDLLLKIGVTDL